MITEITPSDFKVAYLTLSLRLKDIHRYASHLESIDSMLMRMLVEASDLASTFAEGAFARPHWYVSDDNPLDKAHYKETE